MVDMTMEKMKMAMRTSIMVNPAEGLHKEGRLLFGFRSITALTAVLTKL